MYAARIRTLQLPASLVGLGLSQVTLANLAARD